MERAVIGNIPKEIIHLFKENRAEKIKIFQKALFDLSIYIRKNRKFMEKESRKAFDFDVCDPEKVKIFNKRVTTVFNKKIRHIVPKGIHAELSLQGSGGFANVFKFSVKKKNGTKIMHDKALKVFYNVEEPLPINKMCHNNYAEANFWTFLKKWSGHKLDNTQFTRHYISDMKSGYYMTEFIDDDITKTSKEFNIKKVLGIAFRDLPNNQPILGKFYDGGGYEKLSSFIDDTVVLKNYKKIINRNTEKERMDVLANMEKLIENPKTPHRDKIKKAVEIYKRQQENTERQKNQRKKFDFLRLIYDYFENIQIKLIEYFDSKHL